MENYSVKKQTKNCFVLETPCSVFIVLESCWVAQAILLRFVLTRNKWKRPWMVHLVCKWEKESCLILIKVQLWKKQFAKSTGIMLYLDTDAGSRLKVFQVCCFIGCRAISPFSMVQRLFKCFLECRRVSMEVTLLRKCKSLYLLMFWPSWAFRKQQYCCLFMG